LLADGCDRSGCCTADRIKPVRPTFPHNFLLTRRSAGCTGDMNLPAFDSLLITLLVIQGIVGGADTLLNHELLEGLPSRVEARTEIGLHALREALYGMLFAAIAWFAWHGAWAYAIGALLLAEILVDAIDEFVENRIRVLPQNERMLHFMMIINLGLIAGALVLVLFDWAPRPTALQPSSHGIGTWVLSLLSLAALCWAVRDALAWRRLGRALANRARPDGARA
jgi:hypothetical protein